MRKKNIVFNVIMPCFNSEKWVTNAIESLIAQTYKNWQLIAINDGSFDKTLEILNSYSNTDDRIKVVSKKNGGYVSAINLGLEYIKGDYFLLLGSDDTLTITLFEDLVNNISTLNYLPDCIAFRTQKHLSESPKPIIDETTNFNTTVSLSNTTIKHFEERFPEHAKIFFERDTSKCFKSSLLQGLRYFGKFGIDADGIFSMLFCHKAHSFLCVNIYGYNWTLRSDSVSATTSNEKELDRLTNWYIFFNLLKKIEPSEITENERQYLLYYMISITKMAKNRQNVLKYNGKLKKFSNQARKLSNYFFPEKPTSWLKLISISPLYFYLYNKIKSIFYKGKI